MVCDDRLLQDRVAHHCCSPGSRTTTHADSHAYGYRNRYAYCYRNSYAYCYSSSYAYADSYAYDDSNSYCYRDRDTYGAPQPDTKDWSVTEASANCPTAPLALHPAHEQKVNSVLQIFFCSNYGRVRKITT